jgi:hypothetical protein
MLNQNLFRQCEEHLRVEEQHFQYLLWSLNCNYFIPNVIAQQAYWFISKICVRLAAGGAPVAVKRRSMTKSTNVRTFLYNYKLCLFYKI